MLRGLSQERRRKTSSSPQPNDEPKRMRQDQAQENARICDECREIDLSKVFELGLGPLQMAREKGRLIEQLVKRIKGPPGNGCALCKLFFKVQMLTDHLVKRFSSILQNFGKVRLA